MKDILRISQTILEELDALDVNNKTSKDSKPFYSYAKIMETKPEGSILRHLFFFRGNECPVHKPNTPLADFCSYYSPMGSLAAKDVGVEFAVRTPRGIVSGQVEEKNSFTPLWLNSWDATNNTLTLKSGETRFLASLRDLQANALDDTHQDWKTRATLESFSLPDRLVLDATQDTIFRYPLQSRYVITGRPGTGKTTTLVTRIASKTSLEYLSEIEKYTVESSGLDITSSWLIVVPSARLKEYIWSTLRLHIPHAKSNNIATWEEKRDELLSLINNLLVNFEGAEPYELVPADDLIDCSASELQSYFHQFSEFCEGRKKARAGIFSYLVNIPHYYRLFRRALTETKDESRGAHVGPTEVEVLSFMILQIAHRALREKTPLNKNNRKELLDLLGPLYRVQIGVDEAADFSWLQLGCLSFLSHPEVQSVTLSGDLMQRLTYNGLNNWSELEKTGLTFDEHRLERNYRQNVKLGDVCAILYKNVYGNVGSLTASAKTKSPAPEPLMHRHNQVGRWISKRISEVRERTSGKTPTVGIFFAELEVALRLSSEIKADMEMLGLYVAFGTPERAMPKGATVLFLEIGEIKGLEFEAVFLLDVNAMLKQVGDQLFLRYFYVASTRAANFFAVTYSGEWPDSLECVKHYFTDDSWGSSDVPPT